MLFKNYNLCSGKSTVQRAAKIEFARIADSWLCAYGMATEDIIVTEERYEPVIRKSVKIPNICRELNMIT